MSGLRCDDRDRCPVGTRVTGRLRRRRNRHRVYHLRPTSSAGDSPHGPAPGIESHRARGHRTVSDVRDAPRRARRRRRARRSPDGLGARHRNGPGVPSPQPQPSEHRGRSQAPRRRRDGASPRRARRRAHRGIPARRHRTSRPRPAGLRGAESEAGLRPGDGMGTGRTARQGGRARPELHRADGRPEPAPSDGAARLRRRLTISSGTSAAARCTSRSGSSRRCTRQGLPAGGRPSMPRWWTAPRRS